MVSVSGIMDLPTAILFEIFLKLSISVLIRCKSVCKSWFKLLSSDPYFSNVYSKTVTTFLVWEAELLGNRSQALYRTHPSNSHWSMSFYMLEVISEDGTSNNIIKSTPYISRLSKDRVPDCNLNDLYLVGSSKGLLCLCEKKPIFWFIVETVYISNPITGERIALPPHQVPDMGKCSSVYEFGFIPSTNNFKVMRIFSTSAHRAGKQVEIFTIGVDDRWRLVKETSSVSPYIQSRGITFNEAYHWIKDDTSGGRLICTFDLGKEKAGQVIKGPPSLKSIQYPELAMFNNRLCLFGDFSQSHITIWTMSGYGVDSSWTNDVIVRSWVPSCVPFGDLWPYAVLRNGAILLKDFQKNCFICCDPKKQKAVNINVPGMETIGGTIRHLVVDYTPSFSSLNELMMGGDERLGA